LGVVLALLVGRVQWVRTVNAIAREVHVLHIINLAQNRFRDTCQLIIIEGKFLETVLIVKEVRRE